MAARTGLFVAPLPGSTPAGTSPTDGRLVLGALLGTTGGCLTGGAMTASASAMSVTIAAAVWRIPDPTNNAAVYLSPADADAFTFSAGPASGSRIDVLWVKQNNYEAGDPNSRLVYGVTAGTAASSPVAPAPPAGALKIGQLTVPTGASNAAACVLVPTYTAWSIDYADGTAGLAWAGTVATNDTANPTRVTRQGRHGVLTLNATTGSAAFNGSSTLVTLPLGFRPASYSLFHVDFYVSGSGYTGVWGIAQVNPNGVVQMQYVSGTIPANAAVLGSVPFITP